MANHDGSYKQFFSHADMVADLLRGFIKQEWVEQLDLSTLERVSGSYISDDLRERADDIVWRVRWGEDWLYVYILMEFQSSVDPWMALRMLVYTGLLYQDLIRAGQTTKDNKLPPVLPLVLYNGESPWKAATNIKDLIHQIPGGLSVYSPAMEYLLLEERKYDIEDLRGKKNLVAALFRLENSRTPADLLAVLRELLHWLGDERQASLRRAFTVWFRRVLFPARSDNQEPPAIEELTEVETMLAERVKKWEHDYRMKGMQEGMQKGIQRGIQEGMQKGIQEGMQKGMQKGRQQGAREVLIRQLELKFTRIPTDIRQQIDTADEETILRWSERIISAESIAAIFGN